MKTIIGIIVFLFIVIASISITDLLDFNKKCSDMNGVPVRTVYSGVLCFDQSMVKQIQ